MSEPISLRSWLRGTMRNWCLNSRGDYFGLAGIVVEVSLLASDFEMAGAGKIAVDVFFFDHALYCIDCFERRGVHATREIAPILRNELVDA